MLHEINAINLTSVRASKGPREQLKAAAPVRNRHLKLQSQ
jgi:hypothetical protein